MKVDGVCKLTKKRGKFVDAHLIPKALTRPEKKGLPFIQAGWGLPPSRRWSSWYDKQLVIAEGESILARHDNWAIPELRKHKLVWSGWGPMNSLGENHHPLDDSGIGVRSVKGIDGKKLRLFFLSLLWRAAATTRREFAEVALSKKTIERLRCMLIADDPGPSNFYPIQLTQLSTLGTIQNLTPIASSKIISGMDERPDRTVPFFRFYFDGLIAHIHQAEDDSDAPHLGPLVVGLEDSIAISTVSYEISFQRINLEYFMEEAQAKWPDVLAKL